MKKIIPSGQLLDSRSGIPNTAFECNNQILIVDFAYSRHRQVVICHQYNGILMCNIPDITYLKLTQCNSKKSLSWTGVIISMVSRRGPYWSDFPIWLKELNVIVIYDKTYHGTGLLQDREQIKRARYFIKYGRVHAMLHTWDKVTGATWNLTPRAFY